MDEKIFTVKAEINVKLTQQDIDDIMVAALERHQLLGWGGRGHRGEAGS